MPAVAADLNLYPNKDALVFPEPVPGPDGEPAFALLHRPMWDLGWANPAEGETPPPGLPDPRPGIWVSFAPAKEVLADPALEPDGDVRWKLPRQGIQIDPEAAELLEITVGDTVERAGGGGHVHQPNHPSASRCIASSSSPARPPPNRSPCCTF